MPVLKLRALADMALRYEGVVLFLVAPVVLFSNSISLFALGFLALIWLARRWRHGFFTRRTPLDWPVGLIFVMTFVGARQAVDFELAWPKLLGIIFSLAAFYAVVNTANTTRNVARWLVVFVFLGFGIAILGALGTDWFQNKLFDLSFVYQRLPRLPDALRQYVQGGDFHPNELAGMLTLFLPLTAVLLLRSQLPFFARWLRVGFWVVFVVEASVLLLTQSRAGFLALGATGLIALCVWQRRFLLVLPLVAVAVVWFLLQTNWAVTDPANLIGRFEIWLRALLAIADFPWTGIGLGTFRYFALFYQPFVWIDPVLVDVGHAHNVFLQTAVDLGLPGLIGYVAVLLGTGVAWLQAWRAKTNLVWRTPLIGLGGGLLSFHIFGLLDAVAPGAKPIFTLWMFLGLIIALSAFPNLKQAQE